MLRTLTPAIEGANCYGGDKKLRVEEFLTKAGIAREAAHIRFYSDHDSDLPIFEWADEPVAVNPSKALRTIPAARHWPVLDWRAGPCRHAHRLPLQPPRRASGHRARPRLDASH